MNHTNVKEQIEKDLAELTHKIESCGRTDATLFYLRGNTFRKKGEWHKALEDYNEALAIEPNNPAATAKQMLMNILNYYNKDLYNP